MEKSTEKEIERFLESLSLSTYEINTYLALLPFKTLTAREISQISGVPSGRIYEVLDELNRKRMIKIEDSRPKKYKPIPPNLAFHNIIDKIREENREKINAMTNQAKELESHLFDSNSAIKNKSSRIFWSTAFGNFSIETLYLKSIVESSEEILINLYLNKKTIRRLRFLETLNKQIKFALERGVRVKYLWTIQTYEDDYSNLNYENYKDYYLKILDRLKKLYESSSSEHYFESRFSAKIIPTYYDIFDKKQVILKLQNPINPSKTFACISVLDHKLASELRNKFLSIWNFETFQEL
ncbi:MAG: hypothetical protein GF353_04770 [Candidatus Lokiarchaeota archaeon]|nr:hypothetical protein [Candidatus Lokiarchaeota archaeon]